MRHTRKPTTLPLGTISEGTLRPEDLIPAYLDALAGIRLTSAERKETRIIQAHVDRDYEYPETEDWDADEAKDWDLEALQDILSNHTPDYAYFGSLEGDGACFGVWASIDQLTDNGIERGDTLPAANNRAALHFAHVTDHGNVTLYRRAGNRWIEVWSVV